MSRWPRSSFVNLLLLLLTGGWGGTRAAPAAVVVSPEAPARTVVPLRIEGNLPVVQAAVGGRSVSLLLDLGGFDTVALRAGVLDDLDVTYSGATRRWSDAGGAIHRSRAYRLPVVELGALRLEDVPGHDLPASAELPVEGIDGYLGLGLLRAFRVIVDYPRGRLVLARGDAALADDGVATWPRLAAQVDDRGVVSRLRTDGRTLRCVWDTGYTWSVIRPRAARGLAELDDDGQRHVVVDALTAGDADLGPLDLVVHDFRQPPVDAVLGYNLFTERAVYFDFEAAAVRVEPRPAGGSDGAPAAPSSP